MKYKQKNLLAASAIFLMLPAIGYADNFTIENHTKHNLTFKVNDVCSNEIGVINSHTSRNTPEVIMKQLCKDNASNCQAKIFRSNDCSSRYLATVGFNLVSGIVSVTNVAPNAYYDYLFLSSPFDFSISDGSEDN